MAINPAEPPTDVASLARFGVTAVCLARVGHFLMLEDPAGFNRLLDRTIERFAALAAAAPGG